MTGAVPENMVMGGRLMGDVRETGAGATSPRRLCKRHVSHPREL